MVVKRPAAALLILWSTTTIICHGFGLPTSSRSTRSRLAASNNGDIRSMLDDAVLQFAQQQVGSERVLELGKALHDGSSVPLPVNDVETDDETDDKSLLQIISSKMDEAVLQAAQDPSLMPKVEELAVEYQKLVQGMPTLGTTPSATSAASTSAPSPTTPSVFDQVVEAQANVQQQKDNLMGSSSDTDTATDAPPRVDISSEEKQSTTPKVTPEIISDETSSNVDNQEEVVEEVDVAIVGAGIGGLTAGAILNTLYGKKVGIYESHYLPGGCAHAFDRTSASGMEFTFDSGPTIVLGCSAPPFNPLRQVLDAVGQSVEWIRYDGWGMIENPGSSKALRWKVQLGPDHFQQGPIEEFGGDKALEEFEKLREATKSLVGSATSIPAMAMRSGKSALIPLLRYLPALVDLVKQGEELTQGTFRQYMDGPLFTVTDPWLRSWLDALAFSLSGLPASRTSAAAMAYVLYDMHRPAAALDYPRGGLGKVVDALVDGVEQGDNESKVRLRSHVVSLDTTGEGSRFTGLTLRDGKKVKAKDGVIFNAPIWSLSTLVSNRRAREVLNNAIMQRRERTPKQSWLPRGDGYALRREYQPNEEKDDSLLSRCDTSEMTGSFVHLHIAIKSDGLDLTKMEAHYTVMDKSLGGKDSDDDGPYGELNMIAVSNPCVIDKTLAPEGHMVLHAYGAANEAYDLWKGMKRNSPEYLELKQQRSEVLWRAIESIIPDVRERVVLDLVGSPLTHERFLRRPMGTYGAATEDLLKDGSTPYESLVLAGDGVFPGIGIPAVALSGAAAANSMASPLRHWKVLDQLKRQKLIK